MAREYMGKDFNRPEALAVLNNLRKICNHPYMFFSFMDSPKNEKAGFKADLLKLQCHTEYVHYQKLSKEIKCKDEREKDGKIALREWEMSGKLKVLV
jgi:hypothetical protein